MLRPNIGRQVKQERPVWLKIPLAGSLVASFLFLFAVELILTFWLRKRLDHGKILYYLSVYAVIGTAFGIGIGTTHEFLIAIAKKKLSPRADALFVATSVSGFLFFLSFLLLNARFLSTSGLLSPKSIILNIASALVCFAVLLFLYKTTKPPANVSMPLLMAINICSSVAVACAVFHALIYKAIGETAPGTLYSGGLTFAFITAGCLIALTEIKVSYLLGKRKYPAAEQRYLWRLLSLKILIVILVLPSIMFAGRYKPLIAESADIRSRAQTSGKPGIIIIVLDTVRQDRLSTYGYERETSPNITKFAKKAWIFDAYATAPWTLPSHAAIFTGLYPTENGTGADRNYKLDERNETIAEILRKAGYSTAAIIANHSVLGHSSGFAQGFDYYYVIPPETGLAFPFLASYIVRKSLPDSPVFSFLPTKQAQHVNKAALHWIKKKSRAPFFLFINYIDPHAPYSPPDPYGRRWFNGPPPANFFGNSITDGIWVQHYRNDINEGRRKMTEAESGYLSSQYDAEIAYMDAQIGIFLQQLKEIGAFEDSMIVMTSDHGEFFSEHGLAEHPRTLHQELIRVPLIVKPPAGRGEEPGEMPGAVSLIDLFHSVLDYAGVPHETRTGSKNLFKGESSAIFSETHSLPEEMGPLFIERFGLHLYSLIRGNHKLIYSSTRGYEFYDLSRDPFESQDLMQQPVSEAVMKELTQMQADLSFRISQINSSKFEVGALPAEEQDEIRSRLKALGYIQ